MTGACTDIVRGAPHSPHSPILTLSIQHPVFLSQLLIYIVILHLKVIRIKREMVGAHRYFSVGTLCQFIFKL